MFMEIFVKNDEKNLSLKIKSAPTEADAQKTQTPIVAKLTYMKWV